MKSTERHITLIAAALASACVHAGVTTSCEHPAAKAAVEIAKATIAKDLDVAMHIGQESAAFVHDGYTAENKDGKIEIFANRPRSLLYAAGETCRWAKLRPGEKIKREAAFKSRLLNYTGKKHSLAEWIAATGANMVHLSRNAAGRMVGECKAADVECYAFLYGCDPAKWNRGKFDRYIAEHPEAKGEDPGRSWEKGVMCPSEKATWDYFAETISTLATSGDFDGVVVTFWDDYGLNCHCKKCRRNGLANSFDKRSSAIVKCFEGALKPLGKKLIVRTWASGAPHFLLDEWVHAPGYASKDNALATWGGTLSKAGKETIIMTKVYNADCQPNPPFSHLLGEASRRGKTEFAEWQITGQTLGLNYLPYCVVGHTQWTMKKARELVGSEGGVCLYAGGYKRGDYEMMDDKVNSINLWAWRQLAWNPDDDLEDIWNEWAQPRYGAEAPKAIAAIKACEKATAAGFSPLGLGASTESKWANSIERREDLLRYTNRQYLDEGRAALEPTEENIARVMKEKDDAIKSIDIKIEDKELKEKLALLKNHLEVARAVDGAMWKYRRIRYLKDMATGDRKLLEGIERDYKAMKEANYQLAEELGSPANLMNDIRSKAREATERMIGP